MKKVSSLSRKRILALLLDGLNEIICFVVMAVNVKRQSFEDKKILEIFSCYDIFLDELGMGADLKGKYYVSADMEINPEKLYL